MAQRARHDEPGSWHHVLNRGLAKRPLFEDRVDVRYFLSRLAREVRRGRLELHAWCVLTTHFHLLVRSPVGALSEAMRRAQNEYSRFFNRRHRRDGTLIRGRFLSKRVDSLTYRRILARYIDFNPVKARLAQRSWEYRWGSARAYVHEEGPRWLERTWVESEVAATVGRESFRPEDYVRVFGQESCEGAARLVAERIRRPSAGDDLDHLIHAAPARVLAWMRQKTKLADGTSLGLPVSDPGSVHRAVARIAAEEGSWEIQPRGRTRDGWRLVRIGLLRTLAGLTWEQVGRAIGHSGQACHTAFTLHAKLLEEDRAYADRAARASRLAVRLCLGEDLRSMPLG